MNLRVVSGSVLFIGLVLLVYSFLQPYYADKAAAQQLQLNAYNMTAHEYQQQNTKLRTHKTTFMDLGSGLIVASLSVLLFLYLENAETLADLKRVKTFDKLTIFITSNIASLLLIPGTYWYYIFRGMRGDYPPFADSINIPITAQTSTFLYLLIPLNIFIFLALIKSKLPAVLLYQPKQYSRKTRLYEIFFGIPLLINLLAFVLFVIGGDHVSIIVSSYAFLILLILRAGQLNSHPANLNSESD